MSNIIKSLRKQIADLKDQLKAAKDKIPKKGTVKRLNIVSRVVVDKRKPAQRLGTKRKNVVRVVQESKRYVNPLTGNIELRPTYLRASREVERREKAGQESLQKIEEISRHMEESKLWFPLRRAIKNYTKSFGITKINRHDPLIQLNITIDSVAEILNKQLKEMRGVKYIETLKVTFKKIIVDNNEPKTTYKTAYLNSKVKIIINKNDIYENIQISKQEISNGIAVWLSEGSGWTVETVDRQYINI